MSERETCGDFEIFRDENDWWIVKNSLSEEIIGKFQSKNEALEKVASILQSEEDRSESESVC